MLKKIWGDFVRYFIRGLVFITPLAVTTLLMVYLYNWFAELFSTDKFSVHVLVLMVTLLTATITLLGYFGTSYFWKPIAGFLEKWVRRVPLVNTIYSSTKDLVTSFLGDKRKFDKPVLVLVDQVNQIERFGFITQTDLSKMHLSDNRVAVYCPISYSVAGDLIVVPASKVTPIDISSSEMMRFLLSGGLALGSDDPKS